MLVDERVTVKLDKSENAVDAVSASCNRIAALASKRGTVRNALLPKEVALHRAITDIKQEAAENAPDFTPNGRLFRSKPDCSFSKSTMPPPSSSS